MIPHLLFFTPAGGNPGQGLLLTLWYAAGFGGIFYFFVIRPERQRRKQHQDMIGAIKKGDEITTTGGIVGEIVQMKDNRITIKSGESRIVVEREHIGKVTGAKTESASS